jgi:hypothetical protein
MANSPTHQRCEMECLRWPPSISSQSSCNAPLAEIDSFTNATLLPSETLGLSFFLARGHSFRCSLDKPIPPLQYILLQLQKSAVQYFIQFDQVIQSFYSATALKMQQRAVNLEAMAFTRTLHRTVVTCSVRLCVMAGDPSSHLYRSLSLAC